MIFAPSIAGMSKIWFPKRGHFLLLLPASVKVTAGDMHSGGEEFDYQVVDFRMQDFERRKSEQGVAGNIVLIRRQRNGAR